MLLQTGFRYLARKTRDIDHARDLFQETMVRVHCARGSFVCGSRATPWVFTIATRLFLDHARRKKIEFLAAEGDDSQRWAAGLPGPEESAASKELGMLVRAAVQRLSKPQQDAFELV